VAFKYIPDTTVDVPEIPYQDKLELEAERTAFIVIDMQNDFVKPEGSLVVPDALDSVINIKNLLDRARSAGIKVIYTQDTMFPEDPEFDLWPKHCVKDTWGWQIVSELEPKEVDLICRKNRYDGFYGTWMDHFLNNNWQIENVVIVGTVSNICVLHTAASAGLRWYHVVIPADGITANTEFDQALTLHQVSSLYNGSVVRSVEDIHFENDHWD
jgi:nicotinamidase-related amidase